MHIMLQDFKTVSKVAKPRQKNLNSDADIVNILKEFFFSYYKHFLKNFLSVEES